MKTKQYKVIRAYQATERLADNTGLPIQVLWCLYKLRKELAPHYEFRADRENALQIKYMPYMDENRNIRQDMQGEFWRDIGELNDLDVDLGDMQKFDITVDSNSGLTVHDIEALEDFVNFHFDGIEQ